MKLKKPVVVLLGLVILGWYYATPYLAVHSMTSAANKKDVPALSEYVDYPAVRESLKSALKTKMVGKLSKDGSNNPFAAIGLLLAGSVVDLMVEAMVTPQGLANLMHGEKPPAPKGAESSPGQSAPADKGHRDKETQVSRHYSGWNRFEIEVSQLSKPDQMVKLVMLRQGIASWKLSAIELPLD